MTFDSEKQPARIAVAGLVLFLGIVTAEHLINPSLNPATHEISEYMHANIGWLMTIGFAAWASSLASTSLFVAAHYRDRLTVGCLALATLGIIITACFATQTSAGHLPPGVRLNYEGRLHDLGSGLATVALFAGALLSLRPAYPRAMRIRTAALLLFALPADILLLAIGPEVAGIRQRLLLLTACTWQLQLNTPPRNPVRLIEDNCLD